MPHVQLSPNVPYQLSEFISRLFSRLRRQGRTKYYDTNLQLFAFLIMHSFPLFLHHTTIYNTMYFSALLTLTYLYGVVGTSNSFQASLLQPGVRSHLPYSQWMAKSIMARHEALDISPDLMSSFIFKNGMFRLALERLIDHVEDTATKLKYFDYIKAGVDNEITAEGQLKYYNPVATHILDDLLLGHALIYLSVSLRLECQCR